MMVVSNNSDRDNNSNNKNNDDHDDTWPLVVGQQQRQNWPVQTPSHPHQHEHHSSMTCSGQGLLSLSVSRVVGLSLVAFVVGALIPIVLWDDPATQQSQNNQGLVVVPPATTTTPNQQPVMNNLRPLASQPNGDPTDSRGPKNRLA